MGGTGKYVNARGYAIVKTFTGGTGNTQQPHQFTNGLETVLECTKNNKITKGEKKKEDQHGHLNLVVPNQRLQNKQNKGFK
ncbi:unnamed protein product [Eruca vesicaria subsp. sativa]|uniref:Uncharacterized protein n=1 Tax=Eruca vesicaria subsp. sativa TaxID=29727 RepID=A0ABC8LNP9_ERUVS|nr:unnamed protein product [Eruca vesicaria subsp. sativa]